MRKITRFLILVGIIATSCITHVRAQQEIQVSQYMFTTLFYNPAYAGVQGMTNFTALHRDQWTSYNDAPKTQLFMLDAPILALRSGAGLVVINDNLGAQNNLSINVNLSHHIRIKDAKLSLGLKAGIFSQSIDLSKYNPVNKDEPFLKLAEDTQVRPDLGLGAYLRAEKYYVGISVDHILKQEFDFGSDSLRNALENNFILTAGYDYKFSQNFTISPSLLFKSDFNQYSFDLAAIATYNDKMWGGLGFRQAESAIVYLGYSFFKDNSLKFGYSFEYIVQGQEAKKPTSHEILLKYTLPVASAAGKKIIRTPRFRH